MNMKDYEQQAEELTKQAKRLEATMLTFKALQQCERTKHRFDFWLESASYENDDNEIVEDKTARTIKGLCSMCGIYIEASPYHMWFSEDNEEGFGDLAGKSIDEIDLEESDQPSQETTETNETESSEPYRFPEVVADIIEKAKRESNDRNKMQ